LRGIKSNNKIASIVSNWEDGLIYSFLQGYMGYALVDNEEEPQSVQIVVGDFSFFAGEINTDLLENLASPILIAQNKAWAKEIETFFKDKIVKRKRYKMKTSIKSFNLEKLTTYVNSLNKEYSLSKIDKNLYKKIIKESWSVDLCSQFNSAEDYEKNGLGFVILKDDKIVSGASSYVIYDNSIEIEIDTKREYREKGLATACGAKLILECLEKGIFPSWDAQDLRSVALAEKLGFIFDSPYDAYYIVENK